MNKTQKFLQRFILYFSSLLRLRYTKWMFQFSRSNCNWSQHENSIHRTQNNLNFVSTQISLISQKTNSERERGENRNFKTENNKSQMHEFHIDENSLYFLASLNLVASVERSTERTILAETTMCTNLQVAILWTLKRFAALWRCCQSPHCCSCRCRLLLQFFHEAHTNECFSFPVSLIRSRPFFFFVRSLGFGFFAIVVFSARLRSLLCFCSAFNAPAIESTFAFSQRNDRIIQTVAHIRVCANFKLTILCTFWHHQNKMNVIFNRVVHAQLHGWLS